MSSKLDSYEQDIEDNFEKHQKFDDKNEIALLRKAAKAHLNNKRSITIRVAEHDIEAIKIKASKHGLPYHVMQGNSEACYTLAKVYEVDF